MAVQISRETLTEFYSICSKNGYQIEKNIGAGSYGEVYAASTFIERPGVKAGTKVAIKLSIKKPGCELVTN